MAEFARSSSGVNDYDDEGQAPLHVAADKGLTEAVSILTGTYTQSSSMLQLCSMNTLSRCRHGAPCLLHGAPAARAGMLTCHHVTCSSLIVQHLTMQRIACCSLIHNALISWLFLSFCCCNCFQCSPLTGHGANINVPREEDNRTPLHIAVNEGHEDVVEALLQAGAKVSLGQALQLPIQHETHQKQQHLGLLQ